VRYVAFLRAVNVGGHQVVKMGDLRGLFESAGFAEVDTYIQSGNVIFESPERKAGVLEQKIEGELRRALNYVVTTFLRPVSEVVRIAEHAPFGTIDEAAGERLYVAFLRVAPAAEAGRRLLALANKVDEFHLHRREVYWLQRRQRGVSRFSSATLEKTLETPITVRNQATVASIAEKYAAAT